VTVSGDRRSIYCGGIFTTARALRTVSKKAPEERPEQVPYKPFELTAAGWVSSGKGTTLAVTPLLWKPYIPRKP
jgi:hypothetical protein